MEIKHIIIHCSATPDGRNVSIEDIRKWHTSEPRNWSDIGYHYVLELEGEPKPGRPEGTAGAHTIGRNHDSIGICYVGGMTKDMSAPKDTRTQSQRVRMRSLLIDLLRKYPEAKISGHNQHSSKACPSFDVPEWCRIVGIPDINILY